jgi:nicotinamidase-related amidase
MKAALVLVDIQNDYFPGGRMELSGMDAAAETAKALLTYFRDNDWPTVHVQHISVQEGASFFLAGTNGVEIHESITPLDQDTVIQKHFPNSFRETGLYDHLSGAGVKNLVICGAMSHMCIDATTRAAADLAFSCVVVHDACATRDLEFEGKTIAAGEVHGAFMSALGMGYAKVMGFNDFTTYAGKQNSL